MKYLATYFFCKKIYNFPVLFISMGEHSIKYVKMLTSIDKAMKDMRSFGVHHSIYKGYIQRHCPNTREGGQPHFKKLKRNDFLTKVGEGEGHKTYCQKFKHSILYDLLLNLAQPRESVSFCLYP